MALILDGTTGVNLTTGYQFTSGVNNTLSLSTGASPTLALFVDANQNIGVGTNSPKTRFQATGTSLQPVPTLGTASGSVFISNSDTNYGILMGVQGSGSAWMQVQRTDATATAYDLSLQPSGGNVSVGNRILNSSGRSILNQTGSILQVVQARDNAYRSVAAGAGSETDWVAATITRTNTSSNILCIFSGSFGTNSANDVAIRLNSSLDGRQGEGANTAITQSIMSPGTDKGGVSTLGGAGLYIMFNSAFSYLYTPSNTTASITMTVRIWAEAATTLYPNGDGWRGGGAQAHSTGAALILMEVAA